MENENHGYNNGEIEISIGQIFGVLIGKWQIFIPMVLAFAILISLFIYPKTQTGGGVRECIQL